MNDREAKNVTIRITERRYKAGEAYACRMLVYPLAEGGYSAYCLRLPDIACQAATLDEAIANVVEQFRQTVLRYRAAGEPIPMIPWQEMKIPDLPGARKLHQTVHLP